ncbi:hypothetical protein BB561_005176 [Smittium simulii]|uniref:J domain-containing protein n=1 Tax=Smittium simulii TaxID=133385 RepID=A0A2T9YBM4_9FUNG|nr:hypothetical protein BB561_005176 [Smittium simulii]
MDQVFGLMQEVGKNDLDNLYEILGCNINSSNNQIKAEFKARAKLLHPDKSLANQNSLAHADSLEQFQRLNEAHSILSNPESRKLYDEWKNSGLHIPFAAWSKIPQNKSLHWFNNDLTLLKISTFEQDRPLHSDANSINHPSLSDDNSVNHTSLSDSHHNNQPPCFNSSTKQTNDDIYKKFRDYQI